MLSTDINAIAERIVSQEVQVCLSSLVSTLASGYGNNFQRDMSALCEQAMELCSPVLDTTDEGTEDEPYEWEVFEHWAVSSWLAAELEVEGEKVDKDFTGLNVWARTTTGQAISMDSCILAIAKRLASL
jgi:hypothetical protein